MNESAVTETKYPQNIEMGVEELQALYQLTGDIKAKTHAENQIPEYRNLNNTRDGMILDNVSFSFDEAEGLHQATTKLVISGLSGHSFAELGFTPDDYSDLVKFIENGLYTSQIKISEELKAVLDALALPVFFEASERLDSQVADITSQGAFGDNENLYYHTYGAARDMENRIRDIVTMNRYAKQLYSTDDRYEKYFL